MRKETCDTYARVCEKEDSYARNAVEAGRGKQKEKPINFTMANSETVATPFLQFSEVIKV